MKTRKTKFILIGIVVLFLFWNLGSSSDNIDIRIKHIKPTGYSNNGHIEIYADSNNVNGILNCTVYAITDKKLKEYNKNNKIMSTMVINMTTINIDSQNDKKSICKITLQENMNMFSIPNYMSEMAIKKGTIIDQNRGKGKNNFFYYKNLLIEVTFSANGKILYTNKKILTSTNYT